MSARRSAAVIGTGFGGGASACRLAESGKFDVTVFERGPRYPRNGFPRRPDQLREAFWDPDEGYFGLFEFQSFTRSRIDTLTASGLGGGSLIYSNVLYRMPDAFLRGWPGGFNRARLDPYYDRALAMLEASPYPLNKPGSPYQDTPKTHAFVEAAAKIGAARDGHPAARFELPPLAIQFSDRPGEELRNKQGVPQTSCIQCGECNTGCNTHAKNTVDLNYLARAEQQGAEVRTWSAVSAIRPASSGAGYDVTFGDPRSPNQTRTQRFDIVIVSAGSLGSPRLLLENKANLPNLSPALGSKWSPNGDLLALGVHTSQPLLPNRGPVITAAIRMDQGNYPDGTPASLWIEDGGFPVFLSWLALGGGLSGPSASRLRGIFRFVAGFLGFESGSNPGGAISALVGESTLTTNMQVMLGMGRDRSSGTMTLDPKADPASRERLRLKWDVTGSELHYDRVRAGMSRITAALGGELAENPFSLLNRYTTVHPLGGCPLGDAPGDGVVNAQTGEVFGYPGLYVLDGSILPTAVGPNPALTIAALAEYFVERI